MLTNLVNPSQRFSPPLTPSKTDWLLSNPPQLIKTQKNIKINKCERDFLLLLENLQMLSRIEKGYFMFIFSPPKVLFSFLFTDWQKSIWLKNVPRYNYLQVEWRSQCLVSQDGVNSELNIHNVSTNNSDLKKPFHFQS